MILCIVLLYLCLLAYATMVYFDFKDNIIGVWCFRFAGDLMLYWLLIAAVFQILGVL